MSNEKNAVNVRSGLSTLGVLGVVFVTLKLIGKIAWPWKWVLAPFWGPWALIAAAFAVLAAAALVLDLLVTRMKKAGR